MYKRIFYQWNAIIADADDNKFFDAAVAANVDFLVTNDGHFNEVKRLSFPKVTIVSADEFLRLLEKGKRGVTLYAIFSNATKLTSTPPLFHTGYSSTKQLYGLPSLQ